MSLELRYRDLNQFFSERLAGLSCAPHTHDYIVDLLSGNKVTAFVDTERPVTVSWEIARESGRFDLAQGLADWIFFTRVTAPEHLRHAAPALYEAIGAVSYARCYSLLRGRWPAHRELADRFVELSLASRERIYRFL